ncbi:hypothetical protein KPH14_005309 [Odynerus spinipes]|uniref:Uncharacterized protein n=1 Tax=Odynerus spinipes TaxID=1348599 RepID=A0AAD9VJ46_9HYME|nr:hypothetical protein KPH14_005309 [Odynerus spinipes]
MIPRYHETEIFTDYLGFTNQTATVLRGLGGGTLINECKKRNISTSELHKLTKDDFIQLGSDDSLAEQLVNQLKITSRNINNVGPTLENRLKSFIGVLEMSKQQLDFIHAYLAYCRLRLKQEKNDFFIDPNTVLTASSVLCITVRETFHEVDNMEKTMQELSSLVPKVNEVKPKRCISFCALLAGLSVAVCLILRVRKD